MKNIIKIISWINRVIMIPFLISLLVSIIDVDYIFYPIYIAFAVGVYQLISFLISLFLLNRMKEKRKKEILIYFGLVMLYFLGCFAFSDYYKGVDEDVTLTILGVSVPIILSLFWTYILEAIKKEL